MSAQLHLASTGGPHTVESIMARAGELLWLTQSLDKTLPPQWMWTGAEMMGPDYSWKVMRFRHTDGRTLELRYPALKALKVSSKVSKRGGLSRKMEQVENTVAVTQADLRLASSVMDVIEHDNAEIVRQRLRAALVRYEALP